MVFNIDNEKWTLDLRTKGRVYSGEPENDEKADLTLTITDENFMKLVMGKLGPQQACFTLPCIFNISVLSVPLCKLGCGDLKYFFLVSRRS